MCAIVTIRYTKLAQNAVLLLLHNKSVSRLTERGRPFGDDHGSVHGSLELPASIELFEYRDSILSVHGRCHPVSVLEREGGRSGRKKGGCK